MTTRTRLLDSTVHDGSKIAKIAEENPDMTYDGIRSILFALEEKALGQVEEFKFKKVA